MKEAVIVSTARTPIGMAFKGSLNNIKSPTMMAHAIEHAVARAGVEGDEIEDVVVGAAVGDDADDDFVGFVVVRRGDFFGEAAVRYRESVVTVDIDLMATKITEKVLAGKCCCLYRCVCVEIHGSSSAGSVEHCSVERCVAEYLQVSAPRGLLAIGTFPSVPLMPL